ncbi:hypothetical protein C8F01DRAFT_660561 [Mycena amicta]|nr:hypothetical protein C8F01DRAFT_660561 [Mycena amicta]
MTSRTRRTAIPRPHPTRPRHMAPSGPTAPALEPSRSSPRPRFASPSQTTHSRSSPPNAPSSAASSKSCSGSSTAPQTRSCSPEKGVKIWDGNGSKEFLEKRGLGPPT